MSERGDRTTLSVGGVKAAVTLLKMSGDPREARHDVRRGDAPGPLAKAAAESDKKIVGGEMKMGEDYVDPLGDDAAPKFDRYPVNYTGWTPPVNDTGWTPPSNPEPEPEARQGVWVGETADDERFVDLTDRLAEVDERTRIEGMEVESTVFSAHVPRERVKGAYWVATADPDTSKVLAMLWHGLARHGRVAVVRRTKRTNQALGVIVPRSVGGMRALCLLEMEWAQNMRDPAPRVTEPASVALSDSERASAERLVYALGESPAAVDRLRDERSAKRAELLKAARAGELDGYEPPPEREAAEEVEDVIAAWEKTTTEATFGR